MPNFICTLAMACTFFFFAFAANAQMASIYIKGSVRDNAKVPVAFANVFVPEINFGTTSDLCGYFSLRVLQPGAYTVIVPSIGFTTSEQTLVLA